jgi:hypothetical protein
MLVHVEFTLKFNDYLDAQRLHATRGWWPRFDQFMGRMGFPFWGVLLLIFAYLIHGPGVSWLPVLFMSACAVFLLLYPFYIRFKFKRCYTRTRMDTGDCTIEFGEACIRTEGSGTKGEINWSTVRSFSENDKVFLLYLAPAKFIVIPKRACTESELAELRAQFQTNVKPASA